MVNSLIRFAHVLTFAFSVVFPAGATAATTQIGYLNGVHNTIVEAELSARLSLATYREAVPENLEFEESYSQVYYNASFGFASDIVEAIEQVLNESELSLADLSDFLNAVDNIPSIVDLFIGPNPSDERMQNSLNQFELWVRENISLVPGQTSRYAQGLEQSVQSGARVLLVSHSQGNFFANDSWVAVAAREQRHVGQLAVGTPAAVPTDGREQYVLDCLDLAVSPPGSFFNFSGLRCNVTNLRAGDFLWHGFVSHYLFGAFTGSTIDQSFRNLDLNVPYPDTRSVSGGLEASGTYSVGGVECGVLSYRGRWSLELPAVNEPAETVLVVEDAIEEFAGNSVCPGGQVHFDERREVNLTVSNGAFFGESVEQFDTSLTSGSTTLRVQGQITDSGLVGEVIYTNENDGSEEQNAPPLVGTAVGVFAAAID